MQLEIHENPNTGGLFTIFEKDGEWYFADRSTIKDGFNGDFTETMIFHYNKEEEKVEGWDELYCDRTGKELEACVAEFMQ